MNLVTHPTCLGDIILMACESASRLTSDPREASRLAARSVGRYLARSGNKRVARRLGAKRR